VNHSVLRDGAEARMRVIAVGRSLDLPGEGDPRLLVVLPPLASRVDVRDTLSIPSLGSSTLSRRIVIALVVGSVIAALVTLVLSRQLTRRVENLAEAVGALGRGNLAARVPVEGGDEIAELASRFNTMAQGLEQSEAARRRMVSDVAHELRTPLTNLIGMVESARDGLRPADGELLDALAEEAGSLNALVDDLRDLALADAGELRVAEESVDVAALVRRVAVSFAGNASGVRVKVRGAETLVIRSDERRLAQVLRNLIQNAVTHSPAEGEVEITVATGDGRRATVEVRDHGPGIPTDQIDRIWERFWRADPSRSRATGGMGLGLPVARRLMEAMGGTIRVESVVGEGSVFIVTLNAARG
jgi:two-component system sensor histidine kinase BaeS